MSTAVATPLLFQPITLRGLTVRNRVWLASMCQYAVAAQDGVVTDWHLVHLGARATGGFGLIMTEATAVSPEGRISPQDAGLWTDEQGTAWARIVDFVHGQGAAAGIQLAHAGRKGSTATPWLGTGTLTAGEGGWTALGPSALPFQGYAAPRSMTVADIDAVVEDFVAATHRARAAGFDVVEVHAAHGYLLHQFLSPLANDREDSYGGSFANRVRIVLRVVDAVRAAWPGDLPLLVRLSATDWVEGGWSVPETCELSALLAAHGVDLIDVSSGGADARQEITLRPGYQVDFARDVRVAARIPTGAVGLITDPAQAEAILRAGEADVVLLARAALREPAWPLRAAHELGVAAAAAPYPPNYTRGAWRD